MFVCRVQHDLRSGSPKISMDSLSVFTKSYDKKFNEKYKWKEGGRIFWLGISRYRRISLHFLFYEFSFISQLQVRVDNGTSHVRYRKITCRKENFGYTKFRRNSSR